MPRYAIDPPPAACEDPTVAAGDETRRLAAFYRAIVTVATIQVGRVLNVIPRAVICCVTVRAISAGARQIAP